MLLSVVFSSSVTVLAAVIALPNVALAPGPIGRVLPCQLPGVAQLPPAALFQTPLSLAALALPKRTLALTPLPGLALERSSSNCTSGLTLLLLAVPSSNTASWKYACTAAFDVNV